MPLKSPVLTEEQRKEPYVHHCFPFIFKSNVDLTDGITVSLFESIDVTNCKSSELYCAMSSFVATWTLDIWQHLNGWPGFSCLKYSFDFDVSKLRQDAAQTAIQTERPTVTGTVVATDGVVCTDAHLQKFVEFLKEQQFDVLIDFEDNIRLMFEDTNISDFVEERIVAFHGLAGSTAYFDCSLDYGNPLAMEDNLEAEIPKMMIRIYKLAYRDGKFVRDVPELQYDDFGVIDDDFNDPYAPTEGETIVKLSSMKYNVVRE